MTSRTNTEAVANNNDRLVLLTAYLRSREERVASESAGFSPKVNLFLSPLPSELDSK
jgi:hypothetical protein